jgi:hypothetical protein
MSLMVSSPAYLKATLAVLIGRRPGVWSGQVPSTRARTICRPKLRGDKKVLEIRQNSQQKNADNYPVKAFYLCERKTDGEIPPMSRHTLDQTDHAILDTLVTKPSATLREIADSLGLSTSAVFVRRNRLEDRGILATKIEVNLPEDF